MRRIKVHKHNSHLTVNKFKCPKRKYYVTLSKITPQTVKKEKTETNFKTNKQKLNLK